jgi:predicted ribosome quality control (RQC) complex YloA/Tae2 family protein
MNYIVKSIYIDENNKEYSILIGKNASGNEEIIKQSHPESLWMHLNNTPSSHIILQSNGDTIPKRYINQVASMLFDYKKNAPKNANVIYTQVKNIKLTSTVGSVITKNIKVIKF